MSAKHRLETARRAEAAPLWVEICDVPVAIEGLDTTLRARLADLLRPFVRPAGPGAAPVRLRAARDGGGWRFVKSAWETHFFDEPDRLLAQLEWQAMAQAQLQSSRWALFHGAALARGEAVVLLVGESGAGKTTLTLALTARGWLPLSDDVVVVDPGSLHLHAFPRCFHVHPSTAATLIDASLLEWLGGAGGTTADEVYARPTRWADHAPAPSSIVVVERHPFGPSTSAPLPYAEAAYALAASALANQLSQAERVRTAACLVAAAATCTRLHNGDLGGAVDLIEALATAPRARWAVPDPAAAAKHA